MTTKPDYIRSGATLYDPTTGAPVRTFPSKNEAKRFSRAHQLANGGLGAGSVQYSPTPPKRTQPQE